MSLRRLATSLPLGCALLLAVASPSWAAAEPGTFQSWLSEHRGLLWTVFFVQLFLIVVLSLWEAAFQVQRRKAPGKVASEAPQQTGEPGGLVDPFKTQITARRSASPTVESSTLRRSRQAPTGDVDAPSATPPLAGTSLPVSSEETPTVRGARRLERIDSADTSDAVRRPPTLASPVSSPSVPEEGADSWADALRRTTQEAPDRSPRRPVPLPPPVARGPGRPEIPLRPSEKPAAPATPAGEPPTLPLRPVVRTVKPGGLDASTTPAQAPPTATAPGELAAPAMATPAVPVLAADGGVRMPSGFTRYAWDHALRQMSGALVQVCRMSAGAAAMGPVAAGSATLNLVTPPPAAAQKSRGRGMKLAAGGETRVGETYGRATPIRALDPSAGEVPGFTGVIRNAPPTSAPLQPLKRMGEETGSEREDATVAFSPSVEPPTPAAPASRPPAPPLPPSAVPPAPPSFRPAGPSSGGVPTLRSPASMVDEGATRLPGTPAPGAPTMATPGMARRALDLPARRIDINKPPDARAEAPPSEGAAAPPRPDAPVSPADAARTPIQKENPPPLRKSEGAQRYLEIPKISRERNDDPNADPNKP